MATTRPLDEWQTDEVNAFWVWLRPRWPYAPLHDGPSQRWLQWLALCWWRGDYVMDGGPPPRDIALC